MAFRKGNLDAKCSLREDWLIKSREILTSKMCVHEKMVGVGVGVKVGHM